MVLGTAASNKRGEEYREKQYFLVKKVLVMGYVGKPFFRILKNIACNVR
jgi:hypothetical protein